MATIGWPEVKLALLWILGWLWKGLCLFRYLNPFYYFLGNRRSPYSLDKDGSVIAAPSLWERLLHTFRSDATNQKKLLEWAQKQVPEFRIWNLTTCWADGRALCALMESVCPGSCPRHDLLNPQHQVNNCRLGIRLAQKHLAIPQRIISPEEMALSSPSSTAKMRQLLSLIKWAAIQKANKGDQSTNKPKVVRLESSILRVADSCTAKGTGLKVGLIGKRAKFSIQTNSMELLNLHIEIKGPNNEMCSEKILGLFPNRRMSQLLEKPDQGSMMNGSKYIRQTSTDLQKLDGVEITKIPFDYQCVREGQFLVSYIPRSAGQYVISIRWQSQEIKGSPFKVIVAESIEKLNEDPRNDMNLKKVSFGRSEDADKSLTGDDDCSSGPDETGSSQKDTTDSEQANINQQQSGNTLSPEQHVKPTRAPVQRTATVTRRRVLRRVMTKAGQEIVIHEAPTTPTPLTGARAGTFETVAASHGNEKVPSRTGSPVPAPRPKGNKSFDFEITYESASDSQQSRSSSPMAPKQSAPDDMAEIMSSLIMNQVFEYIRDKASTDFMSHRSIIQRRPANHKPLYVTKSAPLIPLPLPLQQPQPENMLSPPIRDDHIRGSPFANISEADKIALPFRQLPVRSGPPFQEITDSSSNFMPVTSSWDAILSRPTIEKVMMSSSRVKSGHLDGENKENMNQNNYIVGSNLDGHEMKKQELCCSQSDINNKIEFNRHKPVAERQKQWEQCVMSKDKCKTPETSDNVTVHTQMKQKWVKSTQDGSMARKDSMKKTHSDPSAIQKHREHHALQRANTSPDPQQSCGGHSCRQDSTAGSDSPSLKLLQSESMRKSCMYISQKAIVESMVSQTSADIGTDSSDSHKENEKPERRPPYSRRKPSLSKLTSKQKLRLSTSLPILSKNWTAFEIDPGDETMGIEEMQKMSIAAQKKPKRATLGDLGSSLKNLSGAGRDLFTQSFEDPTTQQSESHQGSSYLDHKMLKEITHIPNGLCSSFVGTSAGTEISTVNSPNLVGTSNKTSLVISPGMPRGSSRYGSLVRQEVVSLRKVSEESSVEIERISGSSNAGPRSFTDADTTWSTKASDKAERNPYIDHAIVRVPKAKVDKVTQVAYDEIKRETGWETPNVYVRQRRRIIRKEAVQSGSIEDITRIYKPDNHAQNGIHDAGAQTGSQYVVQNDVPRIVCDRHNDSTSSSANEREGSSPEERNKQPSNSLRPSRQDNSSNGTEHVENGERLQPLRQSTVDTVDSGIADDHNVSSPLRSSPSSHRIISGHRALARRPYRGMIPLDPNLISSNPTANSNDEELQKSNKSRSPNKEMLSKITRAHSPSDPRKNKRRLPSREDSYSVSDDEQSKPVTVKRSAFKGKSGSFKRKVMFSRKIMMYKRSSSRSSRQSSRHSKDSSQSSKSSIQSLVQDSMQKSPTHSLDNGLDTHTSIMLKGTKIRHKRKMEDLTRGVSQASRGSPDTSPDEDSFLFDFNGDKRTECCKAGDLPCECMEYSKKKSIYKDLFGGSLDAELCGSTADIRRNSTEATDHLPNPVATLHLDSNPDFLPSSIEEDYCGFGLSSDGRKDLLGEISLFSTLGTFHDKPVNEEAEGQSIADKGYDSLQDTLSHDISIDSVTNGRVADTRSGSEISSEITPVTTQSNCDQQSDFSSQDFITEALGEDYVSFTGLLNTNGIRRDLSFRDSFMGLFNDEDLWLGDEVEEYYEDSSVPVPRKCVAFGAGLRYGKVGAKNNFQVETRRAGNGALTVAIQGPHSQTVLETRVTYTGDNLYEVIFEVTQPGYYIINVKWSDFNVPDSPFICKVTF